MNEKFSPAGFSVSNKILYKNPSSGSACGIRGCKKTGSLRASAYRKSKKLLYGLLALKIPVTNLAYVDKTGGRIADPPDVQFA